MSIKQIVEDLLTEKPATRDNDDLLYWWVCKRINPDAVKKDFTEVIVNRERYALPNYSTVITSRNSVTRERPELDSEEHKNKRRKKRKQESATV